MIVEIRRNETAKSELDFHTNFLDENTTMSCRLYCFMNDIKSKPLCSCGKQLRFLKLNRGFYKTCGDKKCIHAIVSKNSIETNKKMDWKSVNEKIKKTCLERYGSKTCFSPNSKMNEIFKKTMKEKYGVEHALQNKELLKRQQETTINKFGTLNFLETDKVKNTIKEKYGVDHPMKNKEIAKRSGINSSNTKNKQLFERLKEMNFTVLEQTPYFFKLKCNTCNSEINNVTKYLINFTYRNKTSPCQRCYPNLHYRSNQEKEIVNEIKKFYNGEIQLNRQYLGKEIDIIIPDKKIAIEFNGTYWHSELYKHKNYHKDKKEFIESKGYNLINIWEDDWASKKEIIISRLKNKFQVNKKIFARKCIISEIDAKISRQFLEENHLYGNCQSSIRVGLKYNNELVFLMTLSKPRIVSGKKKIENSLEITRICSKIGINVIGGFSKVLKFIKQNNNYELYSYVDCDWASLKNNGYEKAGFKFANYINPGFKWVIKGKRENRINFQKHKLHKIFKNIDKSKTEIEIMYDMGYYRIFDSGNLLYKI